MIYLKCGCAVTEKGKFVVGERCKYCTECGVVSEIHPFGDKKLDEVEH